MNGCTIDDADVDKLSLLGSVLIPAAGNMPRADAVPGYNEALRTAAKACGYTETEIRTALTALDLAIDWSGAKVLADSNPDAFRILSMLASAAYYMTPTVLGCLKFPVERHHPAEMEDFVSEYETGILDAVTDRGQRYRDISATS